MLRSGLPVVAVAQATGFADQSHFARHFRRTFGLSPARYARLASGRSAALDPLRDAEGHGQA